MNCDPKELRRAAEKAYEPCSDFFWLLRKISYMERCKGDNEAPVFVIGEIGEILIEEAERRLEALLEKMEGSRDDASAAGHCP